MYTKKKSEKLLKLYENLRQKIIEYINIKQKKEN